MRTIYKVWRRPINPQAHQLQLRRDQHQVYRKSSSTKLPQWSQRQKIITENENVPSKTWKRTAICPATQEEHMSSLQEVASAREKIWGVKITCMLSYCAQLMAPLTNQAIQTQTSVRGSMRLPESGRQYQHLSPQRRLPKSSENRSAK
jgi:hypothetical protein